MGDYTPVTFRVPGLDGLSKKKKKKLSEFLDRTVDLGFADHGFDTEETDRWSTDTWTWEEVRCGTVECLDRKEITAIVQKIRDVGLDPDGFEFWEYPRYEYLGYKVAYRDGLIVTGECDSRGDLLLRGGLFKPTMPDAEIASIVRKVLGFPDWIEALDLAGLQVKNVTLAPTTEEEGAA